jgi:hypothetical protein
MTFLQPLGILFWCHTEAWIQCFNRQRCHDSHRREIGLDAKAASDVSLPPRTRVR